jgi:hypothetical protein
VVVLVDRRRCVHCGAVVVQQATGEPVWWHVEVFAGAGVLVYRVCRIEGPTAVAEPWLQVGFDSLALVPDVS